MSVTARWVQRWLDDPDRIMLTDAETGRQWTGAQLEFDTARLASLLAAAGVAAGGRVALACRPSADTAIAFAAILRLGAAVVAVNPASTDHEIEYCCELAHPQLAIIDRAGQTERWPVPVRQVRALTGLPAANRPAPLDEADVRSTALICFTSGTTGAAKAVPLTQANLAAGTDALVAAWQWTPADVLVSALPMFHVHGLVVALAASFQAGAGIVVQRRFDPAAVAEDVERFGATMFFAVPTMWWRIEQAGLVPRLRGLRLATSGSAPLDPLLCDRLAAELGQLPVERYGMSETVILTSNPVDGDRKPGSVGVPLPGVQLRLADDGEVEVTGPSVFAGYLPGAEAAAADRDHDFTPDGWFRTGDLGELDEDGYLFLTGRAAETIITGGHNVSPREIEELLRSHPAVSDAGVVGRPDPEWGQLLVAVISPASAAAHLAELEELCAAHLSSYKQPASWRFAAELPRNAMGKLQRDRLLAGPAGTVGS